MPLSPSVILGATPRERTYRLFDGHGLYLEVSRSNSKLWRIKYRFLGREKRLSLGAFPVVDLNALRCDPLVTAT